jgi:hypothetical protein
MGVASFHCERDTLLRVSRKRSAKKLENARDRCTDASQIKNSSRDRTARARLACSELDSPIFVTRNAELTVAFNLLTSCATAHL